MFHDLHLFLSAAVQHILYKHMPAQIDISWTQDVETSDHVMDIRGYIQGVHKVVTGSGSEATLGSGFDYPASRARFFGKTR